ncbi:MAG TPA: DUF4013 domain-containing protein [Vicinamibacteria bacterium]|nr:DUF4013 domain-containing protein [Vicinamibacteria bacterium]
MSTALPAPAGGTLDFGRAFTVVTEDPEWIKKILIGGLFTLACALLVGVPFVLGYFARTTRNVAAGLERPLPEWDDLGGMFSEGLRLTAVYLLHVLGVVAVMSALGCLAMLPVMALGGMRSHQDASQAASALTGLAMVAVYGVSLLFSLALWVYLPSALVRVAMLGGVAEGFAWRENVAFIRVNLPNYALSLVVGLVGGLLAQVGVLLCCVGVFPAAFWGYLALAHALGQTARLNPGAIGRAPGFAS